ncbi:hypothetical protein FACS189456_2080 [Bacteroidia bacterium]|nr:hypothetical protein FACS189456_2080 [Bacteroidia bacterium]
MVSDDKDKRKNEYDYHFDDTDVPIYCLGNKQDVRIGLYWIVESEHPDFCDCNFVEVVGKSDTGISVMMGRAKENPQREVQTYSYAELQSVICTWWADYEEEFSEGEREGLKDIEEGERISRRLMNRSKW